MTKRAHPKDKTFRPWPHQVYVTHVARAMVPLLGFVAASLVVGVCGYHFFEGLDWLQAFLNASMILGGMGPVDDLHTVAGKLFASVYAIYSGLFLIGATGLLMAPMFHGILHRFHVENDQDDDHNNDENGG